MNLATYKIFTHVESPLKSVPSFLVKVGEGLRFSDLIVQREMSGKNGYAQNRNTLTGVSRYLCILKEGRKIKKSPRRFLKKSAFSQVLACGLLL